MKRKFLYFLLFAATSASSQTLTHHYEPYTQDVVPNGILSCNESGSPFDSSYFTTFNLSNSGYGIVGNEYQVTHVAFGIEQLSGVASYPITIRLYSTSQNFPAGFGTLEGYTLEAESTVQVPAQQLSIYSAAINASIPTDKVLVVAISYEEDPLGNAVLVLGGNPNGSWGSTWTISPECEVFQPTTMATIAAMYGIPGSFALVVNVIGQGTLGLNPHEMEPFTIYPNPTSALLTIESPNTIERITVADATGKIIAMPAVQGNIIDLSSLSDGIYYLTFSYASETLVRKVVKK